MSSVDIQTRAVAVSGGVTGGVCILALERELCFDPGLQFQGSLDLDLVECSVHSNDSCGDGVLFNGNPDVMTDCLTTGGYVDGTSRNLLMDCSYFGELVADVTDPFKGVEVPDVSAETCQDADGVTAYLDSTPWWQGWLISSANAAATGGGGGGGGGGGTTTFTPGLYCGDMNFTSDNILEPGVYFIEGDFAENGGTITGDGVILVYMNSDSTFDFRGNGDLAITAPTADEIMANNDLLASSDADGDGIDDNAFALISDTQAVLWAGLVLYNMATDGLGDINSCANKINGTSGISAVGAIYFPNTCITFTGNNKTSANGECLQVIGGNVILSGDNGLDSTGCDPSYNMATFASMVGLVE